MSQGNLPLAKHTEVKITQGDTAAAESNAWLHSGLPVRNLSFEHLRVVAQTVLLSLHFSNYLANVIKIDSLYIYISFKNEVIGGFSVSICQLPLVPPQRSSLQWEQCKLPGGFCQQFTRLWLLEKFIVCFCITHT